MLHQAKSASSCCTYAVSFLSAGSETRQPSNSTSPVSRPWLRRRLATSSSVVFPAPLLPMTAYRVLGGTRPVMPLRSRRSAGPSPPLALGSGMASDTASNEMLQPRGARASPGSSAGAAEAVGVATPPPPPGVDAAMAASRSARRDRGDSSMLLGDAGCGGRGAALVGGLASGSSPVKAPSWAGKLEAGCDVCTRAKQSQLCPTVPAHRRAGALQVTAQHSSVMCTLPLGSNAWQCVGLQSVQTQQPFA